MQACVGAISLLAGANSPLPDEKRLNSRPEFEPPPGAFGGFKGAGRVAMMFTPVVCFREFYNKTGVSRSFDLTRARNVGGLWVGV